MSPLLGKGIFVLYRDYDLAKVKGSSGPILDRMRKDIISIFKKDCLANAKETNISETDLSNVKFNLLTGKYFSFRKG